MLKSLRIASMFTAGVAIFGLTSLPAAHQATAAQCVKGVESWDRLNVRSGPSVRYPVVFSLRYNQCGISKPWSCRGNWCKISFRGKVGWANHRFLYVDEGGDGYQSPPRATRFNAPRLNGVRIDGRLSAYTGFNMPRAARAFCRKKGYRVMKSYRVATAYQTIAIRDHHIFHNGPRTNTAFRYIVCQ